MEVELSELVSGTPRGTAGGVELGWGSQREKACYTRNDLVFEQAFHRSIVTFPMWRTPS